jgi:phosphate transport system substrate-binding protein
LCKGDYKNNVNEQPVSASLNRIGYSGISYKTSSVRAVQLAKEEGKSFIEVTPDNAISGKYPLACFL